MRDNGFHFSQVVVVLSEDNRLVNRIQPGCGRVEDHLAEIVGQRQEEQGERALDPACNEEGRAVQGEGSKVIAACLRERRWNGRIGVDSRGKVLAQCYQIVGGFGLPALLLVPMLEAGSKVHCLV